MQVKDIMKKDVISVKLSTPLLGLIGQFKLFHTFPMVPVVDDSNKLIGKVSFEDLLNVFDPYDASTKRLMRAMPFVDLEESVDIFSVDLPAEMAYLLVVDDFMDSKVISADQNEELKDAYKTMKLNNMVRIPVVDEDKKLVGMLGIFDIVLALFKDKGMAV